MIYTPESVMDFGVNKGFTLREIYRYFPEYLKWLILNSNDFCIEIEKFKCLGLPTPFSLSATIKKKIDDVFGNSYSHLMTQNLLRNSKASKVDLKNNISDEAMRKTEEYFGVVGVTPHNNLNYAKKIIAQLKIEPSESIFLFGKDCIKRNADKKSRFMSESSYKEQFENVARWKEQLKKYHVAFQKLEEKELSILEEYENEVAEGLFEDMRDQEIDNIYREMRGAAYEDDPDNYWNTD